MRARSEQGKQQKGRSKVPPLRHAEREERTYDDRRGLGHLSNLFILLHNALDSRLDNLKRMAARIVQGPRSMRGEELIEDGMEDA